MLHKTLPVIAESAKELDALRRAQRDERKRERLHALWLLANGAARNRTALARQLGRNRATIRHWLGEYAQGGLPALLRPARPTGPPSQGGIALPLAVQAAIRARLAQPRGERGYLALWRWARAEHAVAVSYSHFHRWVHYRLGAGLKVARKSHGQKKKPTSEPMSSRV